MEQKLTYQVCLLRDGEEVAMEHGKSCIRFNDLQTALDYYNSQLQWLRRNYNYQEITPNVARFAGKLFDDIAERGTNLQFCVILDGRDVDENDVTFYYKGELDD